MNLLTGEKIIKQGAANFRKTGLNAVGGTLYLTNQRIIFEGHGFNFGGKTKVDLDLNQLVRCQSGKTMLLSGEIELFDRYNNLYTFVVNGRKAWADALEAQIVNHRNNTDPNITRKRETTIINAEKDDSLDKLRKLKQLYDDGVISEEEFKQAKQKLLNNL